MSARGTIDAIRSARPSMIARVRTLLRSRPNVIDVGLGCREGTQCRDPQVWRVYVSRKVPATQLAAYELVPDRLFGLHTDVIVACRGLPAAGPTTYTASAEITNIAKDGGSLGCFAQKGSDVVLLSAAHVVFASNSSQSNPNLAIYSPNYSICCGGGEKIAVSQGSWSDGFRAAGSAYDTDCAIAKLAGSVQYSNQLPQIGMITGAAPTPSAAMVPTDWTTMPTDQQLVRMYSSLRTGGGLRYGTIALINGSSSSPLSPGPFQDPSDAAKDIRTSINQLVVIPRLPPIANETQAAYTARYSLFASSGGVLTFALPGDSGSVVVDNQSGTVSVIGLLIREYSAAAIRANLTSQGTPIPDALQVIQNVGIVTPISNVLSQMQITIPSGLAGTAPAAGAVVAVRSSRRGASPQPAPVFDPDAARATIEQLWGRLAERRHGALITAKFEEHRREAGRLVNAVRRVSATWIRCQGPAFMRHVLRNLGDPSHRIPRVINGASFADLLRQMPPLLQRYGSVRLRRDLRRLGPFGIKLLTRVNSVHDVPEVLTLIRRERS
jgi:hypothetical protein